MVAALVANWTFGCTECISINFKREYIQENLSFCIKVIIKAIIYSNSIQNVILLIKSYALKFQRSGKIFKKQWLNMQMQSLKPFFFFLREMYLLETYLKGNLTFFSYYFFSPPLLFLMMACWTVGWTPHSFSLPYLD